MSTTLPIEDTFDLHYPSGNKIRIFARFMGLVPIGSMTGLAFDLLESAIINKQSMSAGSALVVDPRCRVVRSGGQVVFDPADAEDAPRDCPYPSLHAADCDCRGEGGAR